MKHDYVINKDTKRDKGLAITIYGKMDTGKTYSITTLPDGLKILVVNMEDKDAGTVIIQNPNFNPAELRVVGFDTFDEYEAFLNELHIRYGKGERPYDVIVFDGLSFLQTKFKEDFEDSRFELGLGEFDSKGQIKRKDTIADRFRIEQSDWGGLSSAMSRITSTMVNFTVYNVNVIATAHETENPKYNRNLEVGPSFQGKKGYVEIFSGFWHSIGWVQAGIKENGVPENMCKIINGFPAPVVRFVSYDGTFLARSSSNALNERLSKSGGYAPLDWSKILKVIEGR